MKRIIALCALLACLPASAQQIYRWVDADGRVQYTDKPPPGVKSAPVQQRISSYAGTPTVSGVAQSGARPPITMYSTEWCTYCRKARDFFTRQGLRYTELDVEKSPAARADYQRLGGRGVPLILVGTQRMTGFSEEHMTRMLKAAGY